MKTINVNTDNECNNETINGRTLKCVQKWKLNKIIRTNTDVRQARQYSKQ